MRPREKFIFLLSIFLTRSRLSSMPETVKLEFTDKCINQFPIGFICYIGFYYLLIVVRLLSSSEWINFSLFYLTNIFFFLFFNMKKRLCVCWKEKQTGVIVVLGTKQDYCGDHSQWEQRWRQWQWRKTGLLRQPHDATVGGIEHSVTWRLMFVFHQLLFPI